MARRGHQSIATTLRPAEVRLLDYLAEKLEAARLVRLRNPETYRANDNRKITRAGLNRASVRYALEHEDQFVKWMDGDLDAI